MLALSAVSGWLIKRLLPVEFLLCSRDEVVAVRESKSGMAVVMVVSMVEELDTIKLECCQGERRLGLAK